MIQASSVKSALRERRKELGLTLKEVSDFVGVSEATISRWENGNIANMRRDRIGKLASVLKVSPVFIMGSDAMQPDWYSSAEGSINIEADEKTIHIVDRSMEPTLLDGDVVVIVAQNIIDYPHQLALVKVGEAEAVIRRVDIRDNGIILLADNIDVCPPHFYTEKEVRQLPVKIQGVATRLIRDI